MPMSIPTLIVLTLDAALRARLQLKLKEYKERYGYMAPEINLHGHLKPRLLGVLLKEGRLDVESHRQYWSAMDYYDERAFNDVVCILDAYNGTGSGHVRGGYGLPQLPPGHQVESVCETGRPDPSFEDALAWISHLNQGR